MDELNEPLLPGQDENIDQPRESGETEQEATSGHEDPLDRYKRNIPVMLWFSLVRCGAESIWVGSVLSSYIYLLKPQNPEMVGYLSAVEGITQFFAACLAGYYGDFYRRDTLCKFSSIAGVFASIMIILSTTTKVLWLLGVGLALNGIFDGVNLTATLAIYADSIKEGDRSYYFTQRTLRWTVGQCIGPLFGLVMFFVIGNTWTIRACAIVMIAAQILLSPAFALLWFFQDVKLPPATEAENAGACEDTEEATSQLLTDDGTASQEAVGEASSPSPEENSNQDIMIGGVTKARWIAVGVASSDLLCAFANGVSFRYFAVFFLKDLHYGPVLVQVLDALSCLAGSGLLITAQKASLRFGRCSVSVAYKVLGVLSLLSMASSYLVQEADHQASAIWSFVICILYLLQNAFLSSTQALSRSLIMDNVPQHERARWSALESINIFGWCGSAAVGGVVVKYFDGNIMPVFFLTAILQVVGTIPLIALIPLDKKEGQEQNGQGREAEDIE